MELRPMRHNSPDQVNGRDNQGMVGIDYDVPVDWGGLALGLRYVYFATEDPEFAPGIEAEYSSHALMFGVRISR